MVKKAFYFKHSTSFFYSASERNLQGKKDFEAPSEFFLESCHLLLVALNAPLNSSCKRCLSRRVENCCRQGGGGETPPHKMQTSALLTLLFTAKNKCVVAELQEPFVLPWPCHQTHTPANQNIHMLMPPHAFPSHFFSICPMEITPPQHFSPTFLTSVFFQSLAFWADLLHLKPMLQLEGKGRA